MNLEVLFRKTENKPPRIPILFVHGAYVGAWCWEEHFLGWFAAQGFAAYAVSLRGHGASAGRDRLDQFGLADYADDLARAAAQLPRPPVLVGHSMGALVVQKYLEQDDGRSGPRGVIPAAVLVCPVPGYGLLPSSFSLAFTRPALFAQINALAAGGRVLPEALGEALFSGPIEQARLESYHRRMQRESQRALLDMAGFGLPQRWRMKLPEMLVLGAERDALIAPSAAEGAARLLGAHYRLLPGLGHAAMLDARWESAARAILGWLEEQGL